MVTTTNSSDNSTTFTEGETNDYTTAVGSKHPMETTGAIIGVVPVCVVVALLVAVILWRRRPSARSTEMESEDEKEKGDAIYSEVSEKDERNKKAKRKRNRKTAQPDDDTQPKNDVTGVDSAPDIIISHDGDSIYETIDGKRFSRHRSSLIHPEKVVASTDSTLNRTYDHLEHFRAQRNKEELSDLYGNAPGRGDHGESVEGTCDENTDSHQLNGDEGKEFLTDSKCLCGNPALVDFYKGSEARAKSCHLGVTESDFSRTDYSPQARRSSAWPEGNNCSGKSSLASSASNSPRGRRIVCQLTMVGVMENGKPVPLQQKPAKNAYFLLEPRGESDTDDTDGIVLAPKARFKIKDSQQCVYDTGVCQEKAVDPYFILEPLDEQEDVINAFVHTSDSDHHNVGHGEGQTAKVKSRRSPEKGQGQSLGSRSSLHGINIVSTFKELVLGHKQRQQFRDGRIRSCPDEHTDEAAKSSPPSSPLPSSPSSLPPQSPTSPCKIREYSRSFSSPAPRPLIREPNAASSQSMKERKLDPAFLQARIQQEMLALGLSLPPQQTTTDTEKKHNTINASHSEKTYNKKSSPDSATHLQNYGGIQRGNRGTTNEHSSPRPEKRSVRRPPAANDYFILEPVAANDDEDKDEGEVIFITPSFKFVPDQRVAGHGTDSRVSPERHDSHGKPKYQRQQTHGHPPRLPKRNQEQTSHTRSRSDTPLLINSTQRGDRDDNEEGPVIVSLKKSKSTDEKVPSACSATKPETRDDKQEEETLTRRDSFRPRILSAPSKTSVNE